ncbi:MAG: hypothetical protein WD355_00465 [Balneolaceae bacterium]
MASRNRIDNLISGTKNINITITLPTHKKGEEVQQDPIRFKNLLTKAAEKLDEAGLREKEIEELLKSSQQLLGDPGFWNYAEEGLAVYINEKIFELFQLPYTLSEQVYVNDHFLITPLLPMVSLDGTYSILTLSQKNLRLLHCTRNGVQDITPGDIFTNLEDFLEESPQAHLQFHTGAANEEAMFFGHGGNEEDKKTVVTKYFRGVEESVTERLRKNGGPLILAGTEEIVPLYQAINNYKHTVDEPIKGYPGEVKDKELQESGWKIIQSWFLKDMYSAIDRYKRESGERISNNLSRIIESTVMGKTDTLFLAKDEESRGYYDDESNTVQYSSNSNGSQNDLLNWTALKVMDQGGKVYVLPKEEMPHQTTVAALFRF